jgi:hypothetical protein
MDENIKVILWPFSLGPGLVEANISGRELHAPAIRRQLKRQNERAGQARQRRILRIFSTEKIFVRT